MGSSGSHITSILQNNTIPDNKWGKFSSLPFKEVEEISLFRVISKWMPGSDASHGNRWSNPPPHLVSSSLRAALWGDNYFQQIFSTTVSTQFFPFDPIFFLFDEVREKTSFFTVTGGWKVTWKDKLQFTLTRFLLSDPSSTALRWD